MLTLIIQAIHVTQSARFSTYHSLHSINGTQQSVLLSSFIPHHSVSLTYLNSRPKLWFVMAKHICKFECVYFSSIFPIPLMLLADTNWWYLPSSIALLDQVLKMLLIMLPRPATPRWQAPPQLPLAQGLQLRHNPASLQTAPNGMSRRVAIAVAQSPQLILSRSPSSILGTRLLEVCDTLTFILYVI